MAIVDVEHARDLTRVSLFWQNPRGFRLQTAGYSWASVSRDHRKLKVLAMADVLEPRYDETGRALQGLIRALEARP